MGGRCPRTPRPAWSRWRTGWPAWAARRVPARCRVRPRRWRRSAVRRPGPVSCPPAAWTRLPACRPAAPPRRRAARPARLAGGLLVVLAGLGSAAAYADVLPGPVQAFAHQVIGAPAPRLSPARSGKHQETTDRPGSHPPGSGSRHARPARPGQANGHHKAAEPGTANGNGRHRHRPPPATGHRRVKRPHPAPSHPAPSHPVPTPTHSA